MHIPAKPSEATYKPKRILAIRLQAMGDVVITLPYLQSLRNSLPASTVIDLLTREETASIPKSLQLFNNVYAIGGERNFKKQFALAVLMLPKLLWQRYDVVLDLQNNLISRLVRKAIMPHAWSEFDKVSPISAGERTRLTIEATGFTNVTASSNFSFKIHPNTENILKSTGWDGISKLVVLNPAGAFTTRNWAIENYTAFARLWLQQYPATQFLIVGTRFIQEKAAYLKYELGSKLVNFINETSPAEAFAIIQKVQFVLSEDSGLMHMAWVLGIPTLAIFGSTRSDWSTPLGKHTLLLSSADLPCGNCLLEICKYGDTHCITRYTPQYVFEKALTLLQ